MDGRCAMHCGSLGQVCSITRKRIIVQCGNPETRNVRQNLGHFFFYMCPQKSNASAQSIKMGVYFVAMVYHNYITNINRNERTKYGVFAEVCGWCCYQMVLT